MLVWSYLFEFWQLNHYGDLVTGGPWYGLPSVTFFFAIVVAVVPAVVIGRVMTLPNLRFQVFAAGFLQVNLV